jgi:hypothetical protein
MTGPGDDCGRTPSPDQVTAAARASLGPGEAGWLVGGCLRDELLGVPVHDVDIVVDGAAAHGAVKPRVPRRGSGAPPAAPRRRRPRS